MITFADTPTYTVAVSRVPQDDPSWYDAVWSYCGHNHRTPAAAYKCYERINNTTYLDVYVVARTRYAGFRHLTEAEAASTF